MAFLCTGLHFLIPSQAPYSLPFPLRHRHSLSCLLDHMNCNVQSTLSASTTLPFPSSFAVCLHSYPPRLWSLWFPFRCHRMYSSSMFLPQLLYVTPCSYLFSILSIHYNLSNLFANPSVHLPWIPDLPIPSSSSSLSAQTCPGSLHLSPVSPPGAGLHYFM